MKYGTLFAQGILLFFTLLCFAFFLWVVSPQDAYGLDCSTLDPKHPKHNPNDPNLAFHKWLCSQPPAPAHPCSSVRSPDGSAIPWYECMSDYINSVTPTPTPTPTPEPRNEGTVIVPESEVFHPSGDTYKSEYEELEASFEHLVRDRDGWKVRAEIAEGWWAGLAAEVERLRRRCGRRCR